MELVIKGRQYPMLPLLVGCGQVCLPSKQIAGFFDQRYLWEESNNILTFSAWIYSSRKGSMQDYNLSEARCASVPVRFQGSLIISISGKNQLIHLSDYCHLCSFIYFLASFGKLISVVYNLGVLKHFAP